MATPQEALESFCNEFRKDLQEIDATLSNLIEIFWDGFDRIKKLMGEETEAESEILVTDLQCFEDEWFTAATSDQLVGKKRHSKNGLKAIATMSDGVLKEAPIDTDMSIKEFCGEDTEKLGQNQKKIDLERVGNVADAERY